MLHANAVYKGPEGDQGFRGRNGAQWFITFEVVRVGELTRIHVRNAFGEQYKYYDSLLDFTQEWEVVK